MKLKGKKVLITGTGGDIANCIINNLVEQGAIVYAQYRSDKPVLPSNVYLLQANLQIEADCQELINNCLEQSEYIDIFINTIGDFLFKELSQLSTSEFQEVLSSNLLLSFALTQAILPVLQKRDSSCLIYMGYSDCDSTVSKPNMFAYNIAKSGLLTMMRAFAKEQAKNNILINSVSPGIVSNNQYTVMRDIPLGRTASPQEIADGVLYLLNSNYITGHDLKIDGGWSL